MSKRRSNFLRKLPVASMPWLRSSDEARGQYVNPPVEEKKNNAVALERRSSHRQVWPLGWRLWRPE